VTSLRRRYLNYSPKGFLNVLGACCGRARKMSKFGKFLTTNSLIKGQVDPEKVAVGAGKVAFCGGMIG
jgi:hypothetical protein